MSVDRLVNLERDLREQYPDVADMLLPAVEKARELGVPGRYPRDQRALGNARANFLAVKREFLHQPHTPDLVQRYWQGRWNWLGRRIGLETSELEIPEHGYYQDEIDGLEQEMSPRRKLAYGHDRFHQTPEGLVLLSRMHPKMRAWVDKLDVALSRITSGATEGGWFHIESAWRTPHTNTTQEDLENVLKGIAEDNKSYVWRGQRLTLYIIGSQDSKDLTGHYFDEDGWVRLLGSLVGGRVLRANFYSDGRLDFGWDWDPQDLGADLGGRFEGAKP